MIIDIAVPLNHNTEATYANKISKYEELASEMKKLYSAKSVKIRPIVLSATGIIPKNLIQQLSELDILPTLDKIQKAVILDTCRIVRRFLAA